MISIDDVVRVDNKYRMYAEETGHPDIQGRVVVIHWSDGVHCGRYSGIVEGTRVSDEDALELLVRGIPDIRGVPFKYLRFHKGGWHVVLDVDENSPSPGPKRQPVHVVFPL